MVNNLITLPPTCPSLPHNVLTSELEAPFPTPSSPASVKEPPKSLFQHVFRQTWQMLHENRCGASRGQTRGNRTLPEKSIK